MYTYLKSDMVFTDYTWERASGDSELIFRDKSRLHRKEGYEVVDAINKVMEDTGYASKRVANLLEELLRGDKIETVLRVDILDFMRKFIRTYAIQLKMQGKTFA